MSSRLEKTGILKYIGKRKLGFLTYPYFRCVDCASEYPQINGAPKANGHWISKCPWCRGDSRAWSNGRGL